MMRMFAAGFLVSLLARAASSGLAPDRTESGLRLIFQDSFPGPAGSGPDPGLWNVALNINTNGEHQTYTSSSSNMQISGGGTFQIVPRKSADGRWTSGRIETKAAFMAPVGGVLQIEASIRLGGHPQGNKQGIWPAFWTMGDAVHHGTPWPQCGELDIMEQVNGVAVSHGTAHCGSLPGGHCNEPAGRGATTPLNHDTWHTWALHIDRSSPDWTRQFITWTRDAQPFHSLSGTSIGDQAVWATLAHSPLFVLLNVAVGGDWPGPPNSNTLDGYGSMMEVAYVAVYSS